MNNNNNTSPQNGSYGYTQNSNINNSYPSTNQNIQQPQQYANYQNIPIYQGYQQNVSTSLPIPTTPQPYYSNSNSITQQLPSTTIPQQIHLSLSPQTDNLAMYNQQIQYQQVQIQPPPRQPILKKKKTQMKHKSRHSDDSSSESESESESESDKENENENNKKSDKKKEEKQTNKMTIYKSISTIGLYQDLMNHKMFDIQFIINNKEILGNRCLLCINNKKIEDLIHNNNNPQSPIILNVDLSVDIIEKLFSYYYFGGIDIDYNNVCEIMKVCSYFEESVIYYKCIKYIKNNMNIEMTYTIINNIELFRNDHNKEIISQMEDYLRINYYNYITKCIIHLFIYFIDGFLSYSLQKLNYLLSINDVIVPNENVILTELLKYYNHYTNISTHSIQYLIIYINR